MPTQNSTQRMGGWTVVFQSVSILENRLCIFTMNISAISSSVADPFHFEPDPFHELLILEKQVHITLEMTKKK